MKIGVELRLDRDPGELFADARAFEAAGVDSLWASDHDHETTLLAAVAAVTWRARIVVVGGDERALATLDALSRGRVAVARVTADELVIEQQDATPERWERAAFPEGRAAWRELRTAREADGVSGLVLANDPRLLDLLRNPDVEDDRPDLRLAFG